MKRKSGADRADRLAAALKENLKRRKAQARTKARATELPTAAPMAGLDDNTQQRPKSAPKHR